MEIAEMKLNFGSDMETCDECGLKELVEWKQCKLGELNRLSMLRVKTQRLRKWTGKEVLNQLKETRKENRTPDTDNQRKRKNGNRRLELNLQCHHRGTRWPRDNWLTAEG